MAKKNQVMIDIIIDDKGTTKRVAVDAGKLGIELERAGKGADKAAKNTDKLSKSQKNLDRNMRGTAKMSGNSTKEFSKMQQGMGGLVGAYATLAAQVFAVSAAFQFLQSASDLRNLVKGQEALGAVTGVAYKSITASIIQATDAQIKFGDAAKAAAIGTAAGLTTGQLTKLGAAAKNVSFALGRDLTDSFNRLVRGVTKAEPELLDELGIILRLDPATKKYADSIGKAAKDLDAFERTQAVTNEVLEQAEKKFGAIQELMDPNAAALAKFTKSFDDLINTFKQGLIETLIPALTFLAENTKALAGIFALFALPILKSIIPGIQKWSAAAKVNAAEQSAYSENYRRDIKKDAAVIKKNFENRVKSAESAQKRTEQILKGTNSKSSGLKFLRGETDTKSSNRAAKKILDNAFNQLKNSKTVESGYLKGMNKQQVADLQLSYNKRNLIVQEHGTKTIRVFTTIAATAGILWKGVGATMAGAFSLGASAVGLLGTALSKVLAIAGWISIIALVVSFAKTVKEYFFPIEEKVKAQIKLIEDLTEKYKLLNEEMQGSENARASYLSGTDLTSNMGKVLASADVASIIKQMQAVKSLKGTDGFEGLDKQTASLVKKLQNINGEFGQLNEIMTATPERTEEIIKDMKLLANSYIKAGMAVDSYSRAAMTARQAENAITATAVAETAQQAFITLQTGVSKSADLIRDTTYDRWIEFGQTTLPRISKELAAANAQVIKLQNGLTAGEADAENHYWGLLYQHILFGANAGGGLGGGVNATGSMAQGGGSIQAAGIVKTVANDAEVQALKDARAKVTELEELQALTVVNEAETLKAYKHQVKIAEKQLVLKQRYINLEAEHRKGLKKANDAILAATKLSGNRFTLEGKINNMILVRAKMAKQEFLAAEAIKTANVTLSGFTAGTDDADIVLQKANIKILQDRQSLLITQNNKKREGLGIDESDLRVQMLINRELLKNARLQKLANDAKRALAFETATGGGTRASGVMQRIMESGESGRQLSVAQGNAKTARMTLTRDRRNAYNEALRNKPGSGSKPSWYAKMMAGRVADENTTGQRGASITADGVVSDLESKRDIVAEREDTFMRTLTAEKEELQIQRELTGVFNSNLTLKRLEAALVKELQVERLSGDQMETLRGEAREIDKQNFLLESQIEIADGLRNGFIGAFASLIDGTKSAKQAFADMAKNMLSMLAQIMAKMLVMKLLEGTSFGSFLGFEKGGITPGYAKGGYSMNKNNYSRGGTAKGPQAGYAATLHGNEAVVPLPDNRSIPVTLNGAGGQNNNVVVNVSMDGQGGGQSQSQGNSEQGKRIGQLVASAVQEELQYQKRSGGILNPYGAA